MPAYTLLNKKTLVARKAKDVDELIEAVHLEGLFSRKHDSDDYLRDEKGLRDWVARMAIGDAIDVLSTDRTPTHTIFKTEFNTLIHYVAKGSS